MFRKNKIGGDNSYRSIFEIKTISRAAGLVRLGGFIDRYGNLHVAHYLKGSDHTAGRMKNFIDTIIEKKKTFESK